MFLYRMPPVFCMSSSTVSPSNYKVYWFSRDLVATQFGGYAREEQRTLRELAQDLEEEMQQGQDDVGSLSQRIVDAIRKSVSSTYGDDISRRYRQTEDLAERMERRIDSLKDVREFIIASRAVVRTSEILEKTPSFGEAEINRIVDETLKDTSGDVDPSRAYDALREVDRAGEEYQLGGQRAPLIEYVVELLNEHTASGATLEEAARIVSAIAQEYERRAGQSRSSTAGNVFEKALQQIFDRTGIPATGKPVHHGDLEIDNTAEGPRGKIGFSCKRTLRERFRQSLTRQAEIGVDEVWFVALLVSDVSREKLIDIQNDGGRLYVPRDSFVWQRYSDEGRVNYALRPADQFINDISKFIGV